MSGKTRLASRVLAEGKRTWIEIDAAAARHNVSVFRRMVGPRVALWSVVKSNAYGHGLSDFARAVERSVHGFCVDSLVEGLRLRAEGIRKPLLVLGPTLRGVFSRARDGDIAIGVSNFDALAAISRIPRPPAFHLKIDTGMRRQGFFVEEIPRALALIKKHPSAISQLKGVFTHFASAKDAWYPAYTKRQYRLFLRALNLLRRAGYKNLTRHAAATGGTLMNKAYHLDAVRIGIGLYGLWPSKELELEMGERIDLRPVLSWRTVITEIKTARAGDYIGYDCTERIPKNTKIAVLPIGYWHGIARALSGRGHVLVHGRWARMLGRISMDMTVIDVGSIPCRVGDVVTVIGKSGRSVARAADIAEQAETSHYEFVTRLNPLIERVIV
jgi:alanine racemase